MPIYDYKCNDHPDNRTEVFAHRVTQMKNPKCHDCNKPMVRVYNPFSAIYHGGGFTGAAKR